VSLFEDILKRNLRGRRRFLCGTALVVTLTQCDEGS
jgi:hypothetical protein